jgi:hypothetical protein
MAKSRKKDGAEPRAPYVIRCDQATFEYISGKVHAGLKDAQTKRYEAVYPNAWAIIERAHRQVDAAAEEFIATHIDAPPPEQKTLTRVDTPRKRRVKSTQRS